MEEGRMRRDGENREGKEGGRDEELGERSPE